jgi:hypothetical protein
MTAKVSVKACVTGVVVLCSTTLASAQVSHRHHYAHHVSHNPVRIHGGVVHDTMCNRFRQSSTWSTHRAENGNAAFRGRCRHGSGLRSLPPSRQLQL